MSECIASRTWTEDELTLFPSDLLRINDFKSHARFDDAVLMDTRTMCEGVCANNCLVWLNCDAHGSADTPTNGDDFLSVNLRVIFFEVITPCTDCHNNFFKRSIPCAFAKPVDCAFYLPCTLFDCYKAVSNS